MQARIVLTVVVASLAGCVTAPNLTQVTAGQWVDEQIRQSASSVSQTQSRLHQTSAVPSFAPVSAQVKPTAKAQAPAVKAPVRPVPVAGG
ncbi:hypothetical protein ALQ56_200277 [Pseudomonas syringae pv. papulans]|nr:hypothetical protein ALQ56_200277 [Pseudomonas syringae pv. papulans]